MCSTVLNPIEAVPPAERRKLEEAGDDKIAVFKPARTFVRVWRCDSRTGLKYVRERETPLGVNS